MIQRIIALTVLVACADGAHGTIAQKQPHVENRPPKYVQQILRDRSGATAATESRTFAAASRAAWAWVYTHYNSNTGFALASNDYIYPTLWDVGSAISAYHSAHGLGLIKTDEYRRRVTKALTTLKNARLYDNIGYGRNYNARTGELVGLDNQPSTTGTGYSALDLGRLLIVLKIVANHDPTLAPLAADVARRIDGTRIIKGGYLYGEQITKTGKSTYQEGRIGYEQYAARGFDLWGMRADSALKAANNWHQVDVRGIPVMTDQRGLDRLTSEPFIMEGLELGLTDEMQEMAWQTLALQARRYEETKQITIASEDALPDPPYYFYYYCVYCSGKESVIEVHKPGLDLDAPRWVSSKAAYAWYALFPSKYTWLGVKTVQPALHAGQGWDTGVYEVTNKPTNVMSLNTASVILEAALYRKTGKPLL